jgi:hypothetical protein
MTHPFSSFLTGCTHHAAHLVARIGGIGRNSLYHSHWISIIGKCGRAAVAFPSTGTYIYNNDVRG